MNNIFELKNKSMNNYYILIFLGIVLLFASPYISLSWRGILSISLVGLGSYCGQLIGGVSAALWSTFVFEFWGSLAIFNYVALLGQGLIFGALFKYQKSLKEDLEQKNKKLKASEAKFKSYIDNAPYAVFVVNKRGEYLEVNSTACQLSGLSESDIVGNKIDGLDYIIDTEKIRQKFAELIKNGESNAEFTFHKQDGTKIYVEVKTVKLNDNRYIGFTQDISHRKKVEKRIRKEHDKLKKYFETTQAIVVNLDKNKKVREINQTACDILGYEKEEIIGKNWFNNFVKEEEKSRVEDVFVKVIEEQKLIDCENTIVTKSGAERDILWHNNLLTNSDGEVTGSLSTGIDITEMKGLKEELETSKLQMQFFANLSHELKTPLNLIFSAQQMLKIEEKKLPEENQERINRYLDIIYQNGNRLLRLVNNLLDINKFETDAFELTLGNYDLVEIVENVSSSVREHIEQKEREFQFDSQAEEIILACDPFNLERVLLNLLSNAIKFTEVGDKITLEVEKLKDKARIIVSDTGRGVPEDKQQMIFERFGQADKSFNRSNEGTGIGLSIVQLILQAHGGEIRLNSEYGAGAEFIIELPIKELTEENKSFSSSRYNSQQLINQINMEFSDIYEN